MQGPDPAVVRAAARGDTRRPDLADRLRRHRELRARRPAYLATRGIRARCGAGWSAKRVVTWVPSGRPLALAGGHQQAEISASVGIEGVERGHRRCRDH